MTFFYDLNKRLANLNEEQNQTAKAVEQAVEKSPVRKTLEESLQSDLKSLMEDGTGGANFSGSGSMEEGEKWIQKATKPSTKGDLHKALHVPQGEKIPKGKIEKATHSKNAHLRHMAQFAKNVANEDGAGDIAAECGDKPMPAKGIPGNIPVPGKMERLRGKRDYYEAEDESDEDIMDYLNRKLAPHDKQQAKEGWKGAVAGGLAGAALGGPVGAVRGAMAGNAIGNAISPDKETDEDACSIPLNKGATRPDAENTLGIDEAVSRKHFQQVADLLKNIPDEAKRKEMALHHASIFAKQNPRFDIRRFGQAAGVDLEECAIWEELKGGQHKLDVDGDGEIEASDLAALRAGKHREETDEGFADMDAWLAQREKEKGTGKFDKRKVSTGTVYTRKPETFDEPEGDEAPADAVKRGRGRPKSTKPAEKRVTKGAWKHKVAEEGEEELDEKAEQGKRKFFDKLAPAAKKVAKVVKAVVGKEDEKAEKAGKKVAKDIEHDEGNKAKGDNKAEKAGKKVTKDIEYDDKKDRKEKKSEKKVEETTTSGSVATTTAHPAAKAMGVGKGIYDSWNRKYEELLAESVNVSQEATKMEDGNEEESITINVTGDDVARFKEVLASMGLGQSEAPAEPAHDDSCHTCGGTPCQCDDQIDAEVLGLPGEMEIEVDEADMEEGNEFSGELAKAKAQHKSEFEVDGKTYPVKEADAPVDQNSPDYPTNQEYDDDALQYAGGLNKPKQTGQTTVPVIASQLDRQIAESEESVDSFLNLYQAFKTK